MKIRPLAFYLPQFHPIPENDLWWGKGFTEWTNVTKAKPLFKGHNQPRYPADLGYYDLRLPETRAAQAQLAKENGIHGFIYYHYWFNGRRILNRPADEILKLGEPDFPFCFCWANHDWTKRWSGNEGEILLKQNYNLADDLDHIRFMMPFFRDDRYVKVDGKPVFIVFRPSNFPYPFKQTAQVWREEAVKQGLPGLYLIGIESDHKVIRDSPADLGTDANAEFQPNWPNLGKPVGRDLVSRILRKFKLTSDHFIRKSFYLYDDIVKRDLDRKPAGYLLYPGVTPDWDNTARVATGGQVFLGSTPEKYGFWLEQKIKKFTPPTPEENFIFINAWNEWAEGNYLEPDARWGSAYLEKTKEVIFRANQTK